ncbi:HipA domain-containing protein [Paracoccus sp. MKU1]|uniref:HipA domain-containing protein n=1 Tax=Paracoccus sp. MKU1 TaxID=1745182 RepID=UPI001EF0D83D|nr:HipA domain-containing protein [Paracoccus sp. MKU1]
MTRYDRVSDGNQLRRSHQEDFCQALGYPPSAKYQHGSGYRGKKIKFREMMERLRTLNPREAERRSSSAVVIFASPKTVGHSPNARLVVTMTEVCS